MIRLDSLALNLHDKRVDDTGEIMTQPARHVGDAHEQYSTAPQRVSHVFQNALLRLRLKVMEHVEKEYHVGVGQCDMAQITGVHGCDAGEGNPSPAGAAFLQLDAMPSRPRRRRRPAPGPRTGFVLPARGKQHRGEQALPASQIYDSCTIRNGAAAQKRYEYRIATQFAAGKEVRVKAGRKVGTRSGFQQRANLGLHQRIAMVSDTGFRPAAESFSSSAGNTLSTIGSPCTDRRS